MVKFIASQSIKLILLKNEVKYKGQSGHGSDIKSGSTCIYTSIQPIHCLLNLGSSASSIEIQFLSFITNPSGFSILSWWNPKPSGSYGQSTFSPSVHIHTCTVIQEEKEGLCVFWERGVGWLMKRNRKPVIIGSGVVVFFRLWAHSFIVQTDSAIFNS